MGLRGPRPRPEAERLVHFIEAKFRLEPAEADALHRVAIREDVSVSIAVRRLLREALLARNLVVKIPDEWDQRATRVPSGATLPDESHR